MTPRARFAGFLLVLTSPLAALAASVTQVKGAKALLDISGLESPAVGEELISIDAAGKKKSLLKITQIKNGKALADIVKGRPEVGHDLTPRNASPAATRLSRELRQSDLPAGEDGSTDLPDDYRKRVRKKYSGASWGILGSMLQTNMTVTNTAGAGTAQHTFEAKMQGSSFGVLGYYDYPVIPSFQIRGMSGIEQLSSKGSITTTDCSGTTTCDFNVTYLSVYGQGKFNYFNNGDWRGWVGGGYGFLIAMSKTSSVLNTGGISTNQIYSFATGVDIPGGKKTYIPVSVEYGLFPSSDTVKANIIIIRVGYGFLL